MESILLFSVTQKASDLHLSSGEKPIIRQNGQLVVYENEGRYSHQELENKLLSLLNQEQKAQLASQKQLDFAYHHVKYGRFRVNIFYQYRGISAVFRVINRTIPSLEQLDAPNIFYELVTKPKGLILVTGSTGSGKSTTIASMIEYINHHMGKHIVTLEDPIEYLFENNKSLIQQRQIGKNCPDFLTGIESVLRQDPDIIMIGELRNYETIQAALTAAETGHLVLATLHTNSAIHTISRIIDSFPDTAKLFIRFQLAHHLQAIIAQQLDYKEGKRQANFEILINTQAVSHLIEEGKIKQLVSVMQTGKEHGMQLMEQ